jgi:NAD(P)-dependent dehydrogenase (short-subunit alcohol dehydrogenase family)
VHARAKALTIPHLARASVRRHEIIASRINMNTSELFSLKGRTALVTGGSRGIGKMIASGFIEAGVKVYISARKAEVCEATARELSAGNQRCIALPCDVSTVAGCKQLADELQAREPQLDILINNAGAAWGASFDEFPEHGWDKVMNLNVKGPFFLTQALHGALKKAARPDRPAKVINIASIDGIRLNPYPAHGRAAGPRSDRGQLHRPRTIRFRDEPRCARSRGRRRRAHAAAAGRQPRRYGRHRDLSCLARWRLRRRRHDRR